MDDKIGSIDRCTLDGKGQTTIKSDSMLTTNSRIVLGKYMYIFKSEYVMACLFSIKRIGMKLKQNLLLRLLVVLSYAISDFVS